MVLNGLLPVFTLIIFGSLLKHFQLTNDVFLKTSDKLTYYIFFPLLLFWKIGGASAALFSDSGFYKAVLCAVLTVYVLSTAFIFLFKVPDFKAGSFSQSCYRFNSYIGVAIVLTALGEKGIKHFGILIGMIIPIINVLCVLTLTWFSEKKMVTVRGLGKILKSLISNPLILACISGILYANIWDEFPAFLNSTLQLCAYVALPLAMLSVGGALSLSSIKNHFKLSLIASLFKLLVLPAIGCLFLMAFEVSGLSFKVGLIYFALPTSPVLYVLSSQLNSDTELASASIALSTLLSFFSLSAALLL
jgi:predicted permease